MIYDLTFKDLGGDPISLDTNRIGFGFVSPGGSKDEEVVLANDGIHDVLDVVIEPKAHPTNQAGNPEDTYEVATLSLLAVGPFLPSLSIGDLLTGTDKHFFVRWAPPESALSGDVVFAVEARGDVEF